MTALDRSHFLVVAYLANIIILVPVVWSMFSGPSDESIFEGTVAESLGLRLLVGSLWAAILVCSIAGMFAPYVFAPLLAVQVIYKAIWLVVFIAPLVMGGERWPVGISAVFAAIVVIYPLLTWLAFRDAG